MRDTSLPPRAVAAHQHSRRSEISLALALALIAVTGAVTAGLVWMVRVRSETVEVGYRIQSLRTQVIQLEQQRAALEVEKTALSRPNRLAAIARTTLGLVPPDVSTSLTLTDAVTP